MKTMKKFLCALVVMLTAVTVLSGTFQADVQAAATVTTNKNENKAPKIKKKGTYNINDKTNNGYIRFVAPKTGTYTITVYNVRDWKKKTTTSHNLGQYYVYKKNRNWLERQELKTNYGKSNVFWIGTKYTQRFKDTSKKTVDGYLYSRYVKIKLKKGETIYMNSYWTGGKHQYTLKIK